MTHKIIRLGKVEKILHYGKCGFICTVTDEHYYYSPKSFKEKPRRLKEGELVMFCASTQNGKPMAAEINPIKLSPLTPTGGK